MWVRACVCWLFKFARLGDWAGRGPYTLYTSLYTVLFCYCFSYALFCFFSRYIYCLVVVCLCMLFIWFILLKVWCYKQQLIVIKELLGIPLPLPPSIRCIFTSSSDHFLRVHFEQISVAKLGLFNGTLKSTTTTASEIDTVESTVESTIESTVENTVEEATPVEERVRNCFELTTLDANMRELVSFSFIF